MEDLRKPWVELFERGSLLSVSGLRTTHCEKCQQVLSRNSSLFTKDGHLVNKVKGKTCHI